MKNPSYPRFVTLSMICVSILWASNASAAIHGWDVVEIFSNSDGTIQFVELREELGLNGETLFNNTLLISDGDGGGQFVVQILGNIAFGTANKNFLLATTAAAALPGFPAPDFLLTDGFINVDGDTIKFCNANDFVCSFPIDSFTFVSPLPTDGVTSLQRDGLDFVEVVNSPTNYAGDSGSIDVSEPADLPSMGAPGFALLVLSLMLVSARNIRMPELQRV